MIKDIKISKTSNACNKETISLSLKTSKNVYTASAPSGTSEGEYETKTFDLKKIFKNFPKIKKNFIGKDEKNIDKIIDSIEIEKIGANLSIVLSIAGLRATSNNEIYKFLNPSARIFPFPLGNVIGGGAHHGYTSEQEFLVAATKAKTVKGAIKTNFSIWNEIGKYLKTRRILIGNNYEGAWMCKLDDIQTLDILSNVAEQYEAKIGIDFAASEIYKRGNYFYSHPKRKLSPEEQLEFIIDLVKTYRIFYIEDPFHEDDFKHFSELTKKVNSLIAGDDIFATQPYRLKLGIRKKAGNAIIIKPDQVGTISRALETIRIAKKSGYATIVSHRSEDTTDDFIADLAVGTEAPFIKCGIHGKEREIKLKRLVEIWNKTKNPSMCNTFK